MGDGARVYLGSAELAAVAAVTGKLPTPDEYFKYISERVEPKKLIYTGIWNLTKWVILSFLMLINCLGS